MMATNRTEIVFETAKRLSAGDGYHDTSDIQIDGWRVPRWITYISRAEQLVKEREAFK